MCKRLRRDRSLNLDIKDLYGTGVSPAKTYLVKVANLDVANDLGWHELSNLQDIRNIIIHRRGRPGESLDQRDLVQLLLKEYPQDLTLSPARSRGIVHTREEELTMTAQQSFAADGGWSDHEPPRSKTGVRLTCQIREVAVECWRNGLHNRR